MTKIQLSPSGKLVDAEPHDTILGALERAGYALPNNCRAGACGECKLDSDCQSGSCIAGEFVLDTGVLIGATCG